MGFFRGLFKKKENNEHKTGGMEDYMTLVRVYFQAAIAENVGITNLAMLPDLRMFKSTLHVQTVNNKLGVGEKRHCKKMLKDITKDITGLTIPFLWKISIRFYQRLSRSLSLA